MPFNPVFTCGRYVAFYEPINGIDNSVQVTDYANALSLTSSVLAVKVQDDKIINFTFLAPI